MPFYSFSLSTLILYKVYIYNKYVKMKSIYSSAHTGKGIKTCNDFNMISKIYHFFVMFRVKLLA